MTLTLDDESLQSLFFLPGTVDDLIFESAHHPSVLSQNSSNNTNNNNNNNTNHNISTGSHSHYGNNNISIVPDSTLSAYFMTPDNCHGKYTYLQ